MIIVDNPGVIAAFAAPGGYWPPSPQRHLRADVARQVS